MTDNYVVAFDGDRYDLWDSVSIANTLSMSVDQATIEFPNSKVALPFAGSDVCVYRDNDPIWRGEAVTVQKQVAASGSTHRAYDLTCVSNKSYLQRAQFIKDGALVVQYAGVSFVLNTTGSAPPLPDSSFVTDILSDILACQSGNLPAFVLRKGVMGSPVPHVNILASNYDCLKFLGQVVQGAQWEARFNPTNTIDMGYQVGSPMPVYTFADGLNIDDSSYTYDVSSIVNKVYALGAGGSQNVGVNGAASTQIIGTASDLISQSLYGVWTKTVSFPSVTDQNLLNLYAAALVQDLSTPVKTLSLDVTDLKPGVNFSVGDVVTVTSPEEGIASPTQFRIIEDARTFDANNHEQITLTAAQNYHMCSAAHFRVQQLETILNNYGTYAQTTTQVYTTTPVPLPPSTQ